MAFTCLIWYFGNTSILMPSGKYTVNKTSSAMNHEDKCTEERNVFYLKIHKTGSTTLANILYNFGVLRNLSFPYFVNQEEDKTLPHPRDLLEGTDTQHRFNIMAAHTIFSLDFILSSMPTNTKIVISLRHPFSQLQSAIIFFEFHKHKTVREAILAQKEYADMVGVSIGPNEVLQMILRGNNLDIDRLNKIYGVYARELGMDMTKIHNISYVKEYLTFLDHRVDSVIITEHFEESLLLLRKKFCWSYKDIMFLLMRKQSYNFNVTNSYRERYRQVNPVDHVIYEHFLKRYKNIPDIKGLYFETELAHFKNMLESFSTFCRCRCRYAKSHTTSTCEKKIIVFPRSRFHEEFTVSDDTCHRLMTLTRTLHDTVARYQYQEVCRSHPVVNIPRGSDIVCRDLPPENMTLIQYLKNTPLLSLGFRC